MERQRNEAQFKGKEEASETMLNEIEENQLSDIEFKAIVIRKLNELTENYQKLQGNYNELTGLGLFFMLALCMSLFLIVVGSFFGGSFLSSGWLKVTLPTASCMLLCTYGKVVLKLVVLSVQGYEASLLLLFSCLFCIISPPFSCNSRLVLGGGSCDFHSVLFHLVPVLLFWEYTFFSSYMEHFPGLAIC